MGVLVSANVTAVISARSQTLDGCGCSQVLLSPSPVSACKHIPYEVASPLV